MKSKAFAMFFVLVMITFLSCLSLSTWYKMSFLLDLSVERERFYKNFYKTEQLFKLGLNEVGRNFKYFLEELPLKQKTICFNCTLERKQKLNQERFLMEEGLELNKLEAYLELYKTREGKKIYVALELKEGGIRLCRLSCLFSRKDKVEEGRLCKQDSNEFVIDHFTINDSV